MTTCCSQLPPTPELYLEPCWGFTYFYVHVVIHCFMKMTHHPSENILWVSTTSDETEPATHLNKRNLIQSTVQDEETNC